MRILLLLLALSLPAYAGVHRQSNADLIEPAIASPTHINTLPAAVEVTPLILKGPSPTMVVSPVVFSTMPSKTTSVSGSMVSPTEVPLSMVAQEQCVAGLRVITQLSLVGYDANPNKAFMRVAAAAAVAEPYAANGVPPNFKVLQNAVDDLPFNGAGVKELQQAFGITKTACSGIVKAKQ